MSSDIDKIKFISQKRIKVEGGDVLHVMKKSNSNSFKFGEAYFSFINNNSIKGWKMHTKMHCNLCVPIGEVKFVCVSKDFKKFRTFLLSKNNYGRLSIPPGIWYSFKGIGKKNNLILNLSNIEHDDNEVKKINLDEFPLKLKI